MSARIVDGHGARRAVFAVVAMAFVIVPTCVLFVARRLAASVIDQVNLPAILLGALTASLLADVAAIQRRPTRRSAAKVWLAGVFVAKYNDFMPTGRDYLLDHCIAAEILQVLVLVAR